MFYKEIIIQSILNWYHLFGRKNFPWQKNITIYKTWISEIMLQQTRTKTVIPYFKKFIKKYPNIQKLSFASLNELLYICNGLGYYKRIKYIYQSVLIINKKFNGKFPENYLDLLSLPGIGKSTAGAILSLSLNYHFPILDANVKRILIRIYKIKIKKNINKILWKIINKLIPIHNTGKFNQALMDLGSIICTNKKPKCKICPIKKQCLSFKKKKFKYIIKKKKKKIKKIYFLLIQYKKNIFLKKNTKKNIWKNLFIFPKFSNKKKIFFWIKKKKILWHSFTNIKKINCNISNKIFNIYNILIKIKFKKQFKINKKKIWYNVNNKKKIAIPTTIRKIIYMI